MIAAKYKAQVDLLLTILPIVAKEKIFALKGGTAINLFVREMPRLSVDIDLTYTSISDNRDTALKNISDALDRIENDIKKSVPGISITRVPYGQGEDVKLNCQTVQAHVKIEVNTITRGILIPVRLMPVGEIVQSEYKKFAAINVVAHGELFGGKICAALDRQHPRDLFDVYHLFQNEGFSEEIKLGSMMFLLSHFRPMSELIDPHLLDQRHTFETQFTGMAATPFSYENFEETRMQLISEVKKSLTDNDKKFLLSFKSGQPQWELFPLKELKHLPAVKWKLQNIQNLKVKNPDKHAALYKALEEKLVR
jgi:predicted nucleotidyltransferase component of viral defense system